MTMDTGATYVTERGSTYCYMTTLQLLQNSRRNAQGEYTTFQAFQNFKITSAYSLFYTMGRGGPCGFRFQVFGPMRFKSPPRAGGHL